MEIKYTFLGLLIYAAMAGYATAFFVTVSGREKYGQRIYLFGTAIVAAAIGYRWYQAGHVPLQNLFEVFLCMGLIYPLSAFCRRVLKVGAEWADMLIGIMVLLPAGFVFSAEPQKLPPALQSWLFAPHVAVYILAYIVMAKATIQAIGQMWCKEVCSETDLVSYETGTYRMIGLGFPLLTAGLILGSLWGKLAWGDWWGWDPKEIWSLASWLVYVFYLHFRYMNGTKYARANSILAIMGMTLIVMTLLWVNLSRLFAGLHSYAT